MLAVIVTTYNDPHRLRLCLRGLALQTLSLDRFQVFVVSDGGDAKPDRAVLREAFGWGLDVRYAWLGDKRDRFRAGACRNVYLRKILPERQPRVLFLDGDVVPAPNVCAEHARYGADPHIVCGARRHIPEAAVAHLTPELVPELASLVSAEDERYRLHGKIYGPTAQLLARGVRTVPLPSHRLVWSFQLSVPTATAQRIGGFNEEFTEYGGEDQEFGHRLQQAGGRLLGRFDLICYHLDHPRRTGDWKRRVAMSISAANPVRNGGPLDVSAAASGGTESADGFDREIEDGGV